MLIYIGMPSPGKIQAQTVACLIKLHHALTIMGHQVATDVSITNTISTIRNTMAYESVASGADVLLFLDSDVSFEPQDIIHLIESDKDVACCAYRKKRDSEEYCCQIESGEDGRPVVVDGWVELSNAGTGIMAIKTSVVKKLFAAHPELAYTTDDGQPRCAIFDYGIYEGRYWGEDYTFCRLWRNQGGKIWLWPDAKTTHHGNREFPGNIADFLMEKPK